MIKTLFLCAIVPFIASGQWKKSSGSNKFDGNYKAVSVVGKGGDWPFNKATFVINKFEDRDPNIYLTGVGYTGCSDNELLFSFEGEDAIYRTSYITTDSDNVLAPYRWDRNFNMV